VDGDENILTAQGLRKCYGRGPAEVCVLRGLDLAVRRGEFVAVMGPSGCGKSTLLHVLGLITPPDEGWLLVDGQSTEGDAARRELRRRKIGFVFQRFNLLGVLSARENLALSLRVRGLPRNFEEIDDLLDSLGVAHVRHRKPSQMSIGEQQRVAVARAMAHRPAILLADEPTGSLDSANAEALLDTLWRMNARGQTIVMITHSAEAAARAPRILRMRDGRIYD
jgi:putative ABC transport system ATP-binding protein